MISTLGYILVYLVPGIVLSWLWSIPIQLAGAPGALLAMGRQGAARALGVFLCLLGQVYASLAWAALAVGIVKALLGARPDLWALLMYPACFIVAFAPIAKGARESMRAEAEDPEVRHYAQHQVVGLTAFLTVVGFVLLATWPFLIPSGWPWLLPVIRTLS